MSIQKKLTMRGIVMLFVFFALLAVIFSPVFPGKVNGLDYLDNLFNMISKGSSYFIPATLGESEKFAGSIIDVTIKMEDETQAAETARQLTSNGIEAKIDGTSLNLKGDTAALMAASLSDAEKMFNNDGKPIADKYGFAEQQAMYNWWTAYKGIINQMTKQEKFKEAKFFGNIQKKALEPAYNYYGVKAMNWQDNIVLILAALAFYVIYTVWYGFGLLYLFEGLGLKVGH